MDHGVRSSNGSDRLLLPAGEGWDEGDTFTASYFDLSPSPKSSSHGEDLRAALPSHCEGEG